MSRVTVGHFSGGVAAGMKPAGVQDVDNRWRWWRYLPIVTEGYLEGYHHVGDCSTDSILTSWRSIFAFDTGKVSLTRLGYYY